MTSSTKPPTDQKLRELRTLKQHYYPEGGWGWVILGVTSLVHILVLGSQIVLASIIISLGKPNTVSRRLQPELSSAASKDNSILSSPSNFINIKLCPCLCHFLNEYEPRHISNNLSGDTNYFQIPRDSPCCVILC